MVVGGAISLIPVVDQILDVRDVAGMVFRIGNKGGRASKDDWADMALAAFGCIPEVGSLFKTIIKPLRKLRKAGPVPGGALVDAMLGQSRGAAIKFLKTFDWAQRTQQATVVAMGALDSCIALLDTLATPHWWEPEDLQYLARDLSPQVKRIRAPLQTGMQQGAKALQDMVNEMLGEDALWVAQKVAYAATVAGHRGAQHNHPGGAKGTMNVATGHPQARHTSPGKGQKHKPIADSDRQSVHAGTGNISNTRRSMRELLNEVKHLPLALIGEHMADYHHMEHQLHAKGAWPHGNVKGKWAADYPRIVGPSDKHERPSELVPEDLAKVTLRGIDTIWQVDAGTYHFVEAKASQSAGNLYGLGQKKMGEGSIPKAPASLNDRQLALWSLLGESKAGTQMGRDWIRASTGKEAMQSAINLRNRWVYLFLTLPSISNPFAKMVKSSKGLNLEPAPGIYEHLQGVVHILQSRDCYTVSLHDVHKATHGVSETFTAEEIDFVAVGRGRAIKTGGKKLESSTPEAEKTQDKSTKPAPTRKIKNRT